MTQPPDYVVYLKHIRDSIQRIESYLSQVDQEEFESTPLLQDGVIRQLEIIGEAVKQLPDSLREEYSAIPWTDIAGTRDKLIHDYFSVDPETVWLTTQKDLPSLHSKVKEILRDVGDG
jgi:uncharacterized protein with HEPN domain